MDIPLRNPGIAKKKTNETVIRHFYFCVNSRLTKSKYVECLINLLEELFSFFNCW